jgi:hypothetical protein
VERPRKLIGEYLLELSKDKRRLKRYAADREGVLTRSGLTKEQQKILLSDDLRRIRDAIRDEYASANVIVVPFAMFMAVKRPPE